MIQLSLSLSLLVLLLLLARANDVRRTRTIEDVWSHVLSPDGREILDDLVLAVREHRLGLGILSRATRAQDAARLRRAVVVVEGFAPGLHEGLSAVRNMSRAISVLVPLPPVRPLLWRAWRLRGLSGAALVAHVILVTAAERLRLRVWVLHRALGFCLALLRRSAARPRGPQWQRVEVALHDLEVVGDQAEMTYRRVVRSLDAVGAFAAA